MPTLGPPLETERGAASLDAALAASAPTVAVVADPFAGREAVLDGAEASLSAPTRTTLAPGDATVPALDGPTLVDDCHHLYTRRIGGFDRLDSFLDRVGRADAPVVTAWNGYAWAYLDATRTVGDAFDHVFRVAPRSADAIAAAVRERCAVPDVFTADTDPSLFGMRPRTLALPRGRTASVAVPTVDVDALVGRVADRDDPDPETLVFRRLARLSNGNPGVAAAVWAASVDGDTVTPADLSLPAASGPDLSSDAAHLLRLVAVNDRVGRADLAAAAPDVALDRTLRSLSTRGFVEGEDPVTLRPDALPAAVDHLHGRRLVW